MRKSLNNRLNVRFASMEEGRQLVLANTQYYNRLTQMDIDWRARKQGATLEELISFAQDQVLDFTQEEMDVVMRSVHFIERRLNELGCQLPLPDEIVFVKGTMKDESNAYAYTTGNMIFLKAGLVEHYAAVVKTAPYKAIGFHILITHELFHCITRYSPEFRQKMYALIGFTVMDHDIEFPEHVRAVIMANPDVNHTDNYAEFTINGEKRNCVLLSIYSRSWAEAFSLQGPSASFFRNIATKLVPLDDLNSPFDIDVASDFWDKMGRNTNYVGAPEECLADNFSYAIVYGLDGDYESPLLIEAILDALK